MLRPTSRVVALATLRWLRPGGSAAEKKSLFDTLVGTFVETSEGGYAVWLNFLNSSRG